jgi:hypothetical protein
VKTSQDSDSHELQDLWMSSILRNAEVPDVFPSHASALAQGLTRSKERTPTWAIPSGFAAAVGAAVLIGGFGLLRPTPSFATPTLSQVDQAVAAVHSFTVTHLVGSGGADFYQSVEVKDCNRWKRSFGLPRGRPFSEFIMDGRQTFAIQRSKRGVRIFVDASSDPQSTLLELPTPDNFLATPSEIFHIRPGQVTVKRGVQWNGRVVDEFESLSTIVRRQSTVRIRHVLYADASSHLPLEVETTQPGSAQAMRESFTYDYSPLPDSAFVPQIPAGVKVIDLRSERMAVHQALTGDGLVVVDDRVTVAVFLPDQASILKEARTNKVRLRMPGGPRLNSPPQVVAVSASGELDAKAAWTQMAVYGFAPGEMLKPLRRKKVVTVFVDGRAYRMPIKRITSAPLEFEFPGRRM